MACLHYYLWRREYKPSGAPLYRKLHVFAFIVLEVAIVHGGRERPVEPFGADQPEFHRGRRVRHGSRGAEQGTDYGTVFCWACAVERSSAHGMTTRWKIATLCLGGLAAVALVHNVFLVPLVLIPMMLLQRAALVTPARGRGDDGLKTGLLNAITWEQLAQRDLARSGRENTSTAIMIIDLDRFKLVNDSYGHLAGDAALKEVGRLLTAELRGYDTVGRFGGEEFVAVLPTTDEAHAVLVAERVRERIAAVRMSA